MKTLFKTFLFFQILFLFSLKINAQNITTVGLGYPFANSTLEDIIRDSSGNLYVCNDVDQMIVKIEPNNKTTVISAGMGKPSAMEFDNSGNLYVAYVGSGGNSGKVIKMNSNGTNPVLFSSPNATITNLDIYGNYLWFTTISSDDQLGRISLTDGAVSYVTLPGDIIGGSTDFTFDDFGNSYFVNSSANTFLKINNTFTTFSYSSAAVTPLTSIDFCPGLGLVAGGLSHVVILQTSGSITTSYALPSIGAPLFAVAVEGKEFQSANIIMYENGVKKVYNFKYPDNIFKLKGSIFNTPKSVVMDASNNIYMTSNDPYTSYNQVKKMSLDAGNNITTTSSLFNTTDILEGITWNSNNNTLYFADKTTNSIKYLSVDGSSAGDDIPGLNNPYMKKTRNNVDYYSQRNLSYIVARKFQGIPPMFIYTSYGSLGDPKGFDFDNSGNIYVADYDFSIVQKININSGAITILVASINQVQLL